MQICLVRCPSSFLLDERAFPPLGLMSVGAALKQQGYDVVLYDGDTATLEDYVAFSAGPSDYTIIDKIKQELAGETPASASNCFFRIGSDPNGAWKALVIYNT